jgi:hypothetical protein
MSWMTQKTRAKRRRREFADEEGIRFGVGRQMRFGQAGKWDILHLKDITGGGMYRSNRVLEEVRKGRANFSSMCRGAAIFCMFKQIAAFNNEDLAEKNMRLREISAGAYPRLTKTFLDYLG